MTPKVSTIKKGVGIFLLIFILAFIAAFVYWIFGIAPLLWEELMTAIRELTRVEVNKQ
jgi:hypothetical protein